MQYIQVIIEDYINSYKRVEAIDVELLNNQDIFSAYVSSFSGKDVYLAELEGLNALNIDWNSESEVNEALLIEKTTLEQKMDSYRQTILNLFEKIGMNSIIFGESTMYVVEGNIVIS